MRLLQAVTLSLTGVCATGALERVAIGNRDMMIHLEIAMPKHALDWMRAMEDRGRTCVFVALRDAIVACVAIQDPIKPEARGVVARLSGMHVRLLADSLSTLRALALLVRTLHARAVHV